MEVQKGFHVTQHEKMAMYISKGGKPQKEAGLQTPSLLKISFWNCSKMKGLLSTAPSGVLCDGSSSKLLHPWDTLM